MIEHPARAALLASFWLRDEIAPRMAGSAAIPPEAAARIISELAPAIARAEPAAARRHRAELSSRLYRSERSAAVSEEDVAVLVAVLEAVALECGRLAECLSNSSSNGSSPRSVTSPVSSSGVTTPARLVELEAGSSGSASRDRRI